jgi:RNA-directed DNA polymerase
MDRSKRSRHSNSENNEALVASLPDGTYQSQPVRGVQIEKSGGGKRQLGIPVVVDRMVQQALQVLDPIFDPTFSTPALVSGPDEVSNPL